MDTVSMVESSLGENLHDSAIGDSMDDLFGDAGEGLNMSDVNISLPSVSLPPPSALLLHLTEMQTSGCCTKLAWSNTGSIARISPDGSKVSFRVFECNIESRKWALSEQTQHHISAPDDCHFVHLHFNHVGQDLALVDNLGRIHLYTMSGGNGKMQLSPVEPLSDEEKSNVADTIVGLHWLPLYPLDCRAMYIGPASRSITGWTSQSRSREQHAVKVHHPADNSRALLYVSSQGKLSLRYQQDGWKTMVTSLDSVTSSDSSLTHADLCEHHGGLLLVVLDTAKRLRLFSIALIWSTVYAPGPNNTHQVSSVAPELRVTSLMSIPDPLPQHMDHARLVQLSLIPTTAEVVDQSMSTSTTVLATFARAIVTDHAVPQYQESSTILVRWQVESETPNLHGGFKSLKANAQFANSTSSKTVLRRQADLVSSKIILSVQSKCFDTILACVASDGSIEFRDRATFELLISYMDSDHVYSLPQSGFSYNAGEHNVHAAISCDGSAMVVVRPNDKMHAVCMTFQYGWQRMDGSPEASALSEAAIVCVARQYMTMTCSNISPDEVLSLLPASLPEDLQQLLIREVFRLARHNPDVSSLEERARQNLVLREPLLPRAYSLQLFLGLNSSSNGRTLTGQYAWALLNLRHVCLCISQITMRLDPAQSLPTELIHSLHGHARWGVDFIVYILNALLTVKDIAIRDLSKPARGVFESYMHETNNPAFLLLLCSYPRTLLRNLTTNLSRLIKLSSMAAARAPSVVMRQQLTEIGAFEKTAPFSFTAFRTFLERTESATHAGPPAINVKPGQSASSPDIVMTMTGKFPEELEQPLRALLISAIPAVLEDADWSKIYYADCSWLGLSGRKSMELSKQYDVLKKTPLSANASLRKCRRCGSVMEDFSLERLRDTAPWLLGAQRYCLCMCTWFVP